MDTDEDGRVVLEARNIPGENDLRSGVKCRRTIPPYNPVLFTTHSETGETFEFAGGTVQVKKNCWARATVVMALESNREDYDDPEEYGKRSS